MSGRTVSLRTWLKEHEIVRLVLMALLLELVVESLHCQRMLGGPLLLASNPIGFFFGAVVILSTLGLSLFFRRRVFVCMLAAVVWLALGVIDCVTLFFRTTPLAAIDFLLLDSVWTVLPTYLTVWQMILAGSAALTAIGLLIRQGIRCKQVPRRWKEGVCLTLICLLCIWGLYLAGLNSGDLTDDFPNLPEAYQKCGFTYCFTTSVFSLGIDRPEEYSEETIEQVLEAIHADSVEPDPRSKPNILFVQLESVMDVGRIATMIPSTDPTPVLNGLRETCSTGLLTVPSIGAGTANTEFEVITGMNRVYFGAGEYPYKTVLQNTPCESLCYNLRELGYTSHAVHNHYGSFYDRYQVFANLGFDTFTSVEYLQNVERTPRGWATDACLTDGVLAALDSTRGRDFVYAITVEGHGKYDARDGEFGELPVTVAEGIEDPDRAYSFGYYMSLINGTDRFVGDLLQALQQRNEPCVVVLFGDHLPTLGLEEADLSRGSLLESEYVIWSNFDLPKQDMDLTSYQLSARVLELLGMENGVITKLHQQYRDNSHYQEALELLEYDLLYGEQDAYRGQVPEPTQLQMGVEPVEVHYAVATPQGLMALGRNFTQWSTLCIDGDRQETQWINEHILLIPEVLPEEACALTVEQAGKDHIVLSVSEAYWYETEEKSRPVLPEIPILPED